ncbi:hypothetical protein EPO34_00690 [Patescibacteria group bacterium]|nr:MAG: hypothetical protein EPO34_00690 [Patescibacteria group bacterium]
MGQTEKPVGASAIVNEVTDPRRRARLLSVILGTLETCRRVQDNAEASQASTKAYAARRYEAIAVMLLQVVRASDLAIDEEEQVRDVLKRIARKKWLDTVRFEEVVRPSTAPKKQLFLAVLERLDRLCASVAMLHAKGGGASNPAIEQESERFMRNAVGQLQGMPGMTPSQRRAAIYEEMRQFRPHQVTATEAGAEVLCKVLRESHLARHELRAAIDQVVKQQRRLYDSASPFLNMLDYTRGALNARLSSTTA